MNQPSEPTIDDTWVLVKRVRQGFMKVDGVYVVGLKRSWMNASPHLKLDYKLLAEHHDREVLEKMKQLAEEGDNEREGA